MLMDAAGAARSVSSECQSRREIIFLVKFRAALYSRPLCRRGKCESKNNWIRTVCLNTGTKAFTDNCLAADISELRIVNENIVWADVTDPTSSDFEELAEEFGFHHLSIEDCRNEHQRPKIEEYTGYYFIVLYEAELAGANDRLELRELNRS